MESTHGSAALSETDLTATASTDRLPHRAADERSSDELHPIETGIHSESAQSSEARHELESLFCHGLETLYIWHRIESTEEPSHSSLTAAREAFERSQKLVEEQNRRVHAEHRAPLLTFRCFPSLQEADSIESYKVAASSLPDSEKWLILRDGLYDIHATRETYGNSYARRSEDAFEDHARVELELEERLATGPDLQAIEICQESVVELHLEAARELDDIQTDYEADINRLCEASSYWAGLIDFPLQSLSEVREDTALALHAILSGDDCDLVPLIGTDALSKCQHRLELAQRWCEAASRSYRTQERIHSFDNSTPFDRMDLQERALQLDGFHTLLSCTRAWHEFRLKSSRDNS